MTTVACKHCGSQDIAGRDQVLATAFISGWETNEAGDLVPVWAGDTDVCWDTQEPVNPDRPYECCGCYEPLGVEDLVVIRR